MIWLGANFSRLISGLAQLGKLLDFGGPQASFFGVIEFLGPAGSSDVTLDVVQYDSRLNHG